MTTKLRARAAAVVVIATALVMSGCGNDARTGGGGGSETISVGYPTPFADVLNYIADSKGYFEENGVDVDLVLSNGANLPGEIAAGRIDLAAHAVGVAMSLVQQGKPQKVIYGLTGGGQGGTLFVGSGTDSVEALRAKPDCRIGTFPAGSSAYGFAQVYIAKLGLSCDVVPFQDVPSQLGALASDRVDALVGVYLNFIQAVHEGKAKVLIDSRDPAVAEENLGAPYPEVALFGSESNLDKLAASLPGYVDAIDKAARYMRDTPAETVAEDIAGQPNLKGQTRAQIQGAVETLSSYLWRGTDEGRITSEQWAATLRGVSSWGLKGFSADDAKFGYDALVDNSYHDAKN